MTFEQFHQNVRDMLSIWGLPINWFPPTREDIHVFHAPRGYSVEHTANYFRPQIARYEAYVNKEQK